MTTHSDAFVKIDRLRFTKNKLSANLALLAIVFNAFYFVSIYRSDVGSYYYSIIIGISVVYNLLYMLTAFLSSEGVKGYKAGYAYLLIGLGAAQIVRIFILPMKARSEIIDLGSESLEVMGGKQFMWVCICLCASAELSIAAGVIGLIKTAALASHQAEIGKETRGAANE